eukprot:COSAG06_NODE_349_length_16992_cov_9.318712_2_plen_181_part_00
MHACAQVGALGSVPLRWHFVPLAPITPPIRPPVPRPRARPPTPPPAALPNLRLPPLRLPSALHQVFCGLMAGDDGQWVENLAELVPKTQLRHLAVAVLPPSARLSVVCRCRRPVGDNTTTVSSEHSAVYKAVTTVALDYVSTSQNNHTSANAEFTLCNFVERRLDESHLHATATVSPSSP